jgi:hypothetical protein
MRVIHPYAPAKPALKVLLAKGLQVASARNRTTGTETKGPQYQAWANGWPGINGMPCGTLRPPTELWHLPRAATTVGKTRVRS